MSYVAVMHANDQIIAFGKTYLECSDNALLTGIWEMVPGSAAPYCLMSIPNSIVKDDSKFI